MSTDREKVLFNAETHNLTLEGFDKKFTTPVVSDSFIDQLEWALMFLSMKDTMFSLHDHRPPFHLKTFDGAWLMSAQKLGVDNDNTGVFQAFTDMQAGPSLYKDINLKTMSFQENGTTTLLQHKTIQPDRRRHLPQYFPTVLSQRYGILSKDEKWFLGEEAFGLLPKQVDFDEGASSFIPVPVSLNSKFYIRQDDIQRFMQTSDFKEQVKRMHLAYNLKMTEEYEWFVYFREHENAVGFKIPINPSASKEIFALRDAATGSRKKAICNFVKDHIRKKRVSDLPPREIEVLVKKHFRGETKFNWRGLEVHVIPSEYDRKRVKTNKKFLEV